MKGNFGVELPSQGSGRLAERDLIPWAKRRAHGNEVGSGSLTLDAALVLFRNDHESMVMRVSGRPANR
jgi:hypothetical protein